MVQRDAFASHLRDALAHLYDRPHLQTHPLGPLVLGQVKSGQMKSAPADQLRQLLLDTIEQLRPPEPCPPTSRTWRRYRYLVLRYVEGAKPDQIARELQVSVRESRCEHDRALEAMTALLWERHRRLAEPEEPASTPARVALTAADRPTERGAAKPSPESTGETGDDLLKVGLLPPQEPTSVLEALRAALRTTDKLAELRGARVELHLPAALPAAWVHRLVLRQVLIELLGCAMESYPQALVQVSAVGSAQGITIEVGVRSGPLPSSQPLAIEARLATSRRLIELQAGAVRAAPREGHAFHATLLLPLARTRTLLVVDDNADVAYLFSRYLRDHNYQVLLATNGEAALQLAREARPDAITLDVLMPAEDGWDILRELTAAPDTRSIPIIICSVLPERSLALSLGVAEFLNKPVTQQALLAVLQRCVSAPESG